MKKILVPCDFSPAAETAFRFAVNIASRNKSQIHLLHVIDTTLSNTASSELPRAVSFNGVFMQRLDRQLNEKFQSLISKHSAESLSITFSIEFGTLGQNIERYILDKKIDIVAMGTKGASGLKEMLVGSNTEKIVRNVKVPVVAVPLGSTIEPVTNIVFPVDPTEDPSNFLKELRFIQNLFHARLHILWINTPNVFKSNADALDDLREFCKEYELDDCQLHIRSDYTEHEGILRFTSEIKASLVFMATHSRKGIVHWLSGSITENVVNHVQCPVWTCSI